MKLINEFFRGLELSPERQDNNYSSLEAKSCELEVAEMLYSLTRIIKPKVAVETGSYIGFSTIAIASGMKDNGFGKLYSIDLKHEWGFPDNIKKAGVQDIIECIDGDSLKVGRPLAEKLEQIDYIHIDAVHTYEFVMGEFQNFHPYLKIGGFMSFHDTVHPKFVNRVGRAVGDIVHNYPFEHISFKSSRGLDIIRRK